MKAIPALLIVRLVVVDNIMATFSCGGIMAKHFQQYCCRLFYPLPHRNFGKLVLNKILRLRERYGLKRIYRPSNFDLYDFIQMNRCFTPLPMNEYDLETRKLRAHCRLIQLGAVASIEGVNLLDIGAGQGEFVWCTSKQTLLSVGLDLDRNTLSNATRVHWLDVGQAQFVQANANELPFEDESFEVVVSFWTFEHLKDYQRAFFEMQRILRRYGILYLDFGPLFLSPYGSHLYHFIHIPWAHLLFDESVLFDYLYQIGQAKWIDFFLSLNRVTVYDFKRLVLASQMRVVRFICHREPIGAFYKMFKSRLSGYSWENLTCSYVVCALQKS